MRRRGRRHDRGRAAPGERGDTAPPRPGLRPRRAERPTTTRDARGVHVEGVDDGEINVFAAADTPSAVIGENIGPAAYSRMSKISDRQGRTPHGGILGCKVKFSTSRTTRSTSRRCIRLYKDAIASGQVRLLRRPHELGLHGEPAAADSGRPASALFSGIAADHEPFFRPSSSRRTCPRVRLDLPRRAGSGGVRGEDGLEEASRSMVPNYAYGQDVGKGVQRVLQADRRRTGRSSTQEFPEFNETDFTPFINAMVAKQPDGMFTAFFSSFVLPFMKQWKASGNDTSITGRLGPLHVSTTWPV